MLQRLLWLTNSDDKSTCFVPPGSVMPEVDFWCWKREFFCQNNYAYICSKIQNHQMKSKLHHFSAFLSHSFTCEPHAERGPLIWTFQNCKSWNDLVAPLNTWLRSARVWYGDEELFMLRIANKTFKTFPHGDIRAHREAGMQTDARFGLYYYFYCFHG